MFVPLDNRSELELLSLQSAIKPQMPRTASSVALDQSGAISSIGLKYLIGISLILNFVLKGGGMNMFFFINSLMIVIHLPLMQIVFPGNTSNFFGYLLPIVKFDILDIDFIIELFNYDQDAFVELETKRTN